MSRPAAGVTGSWGAAGAVVGLTGVAFESVSLLVVAVWIIVVVGYERKFG